MDERERDSEFYGIIAVSYSPEELARLYSFSSPRPSLKAWYVAVSAKRANYGYGLSA